MKTEKKLYRVDINLKYLIYTDEEYEQENVFNWIKTEVHSGELDDACEIYEVKSVKEIEDDFDMEYFPYCADAEDRMQELTLEEIVEELGLDAKKLIQRLESLGYTVTKK